MIVQGLRWGPEAVEEVSEAYEWYKERSERAAGRFLFELDRAVMVVLDYPSIGSKTFGMNRKIPVIGYPYNLIYRINQGVVNFIACAHQEREPKYWVKRTIN